MRGAICINWWFSRMFVDNCLPFGFGMCVLDGIGGTKSVDLIVR